MRSLWRDYRADTVRLANEEIPLERGGPSLVHYDIAKLAFFILASVDTRVRDLVSNKVVQLGRHLVGDGVPHRLSVAASSHPAAAQAREAAADEYVAQHGLLLRWLNRRYVLREGQRQRVCVIG